MTNFTTTGGFAAEAPLGAIKARIGDWLRAGAERRARRETYRRTVRELSALSNRDLADMGIGRASIEEIALRHAGLI